MRQLAISVSLIFTTLISSSTAAFPVQHWGFKLGYTAAGQKWEHELISDDEISMRSGFHVGMFTEWFDYKNLSLTIGMNYEQKGANYTTYLTDDLGRSLGEQTLTSRLDYLSVPMLIKYTKRRQDASPYVLAGPRFDIFLGYAKGKGDLVWGIEDKYKDVVFGLSGGFGFEWTNFVSREIFVEFVYNYDPFWLYESKNVLSGNIFRVKNKSFNISIGIGL